MSAMKSERSALFCAVLTAVAIALSGCKSPTPIVQVAEITSITAPDTVAVGTAFPVAYHAILGHTSGFELDHIDTVETVSSLEIRIWSRDVNYGHEALQVFTEGDWAFVASPTEVGEFRIVADQPDGSTTEKTVTVLP
jgi:hypothetical protein